MRQTWLQGIHVIFSSILVLKLSLVTGEGSRWPYEDDTVNRLMISWHNEARRRMSECLVPGQPASERLSELVCQFILQQNVQRVITIFKYIQCVVRRTYELHVLNTMQCDPGAQCATTLR
ncbi:hypothetical protein FGIG_10845 [Fasciola gigantica]|uniref:SCP domain-containing protein n=1 Tax=Fasciola gigantica TaxID=46835 RepID=A0A504YPR1_FASGI|nr:hypothetical protein FGIG_10845 [Fasciola gigantica]